MSTRLWIITALVLGLAGCGTTRSSDTQRTATEQLLISDAIDRSVESISLEGLSGQPVFLDDQYLKESVDSNYLISTLRQHLLANGCVLKDTRDEAEFVVEARAGAVGTNRHDLLFGVPAMNVPQILPLPGIPTAIPEVPIAKRRDQRGIAKIAVFAYHRETGLPVWQSGTSRQESVNNDVWILGAGPFEHGTVHRGTKFVGKKLSDESNHMRFARGRGRPVSVAQEATFYSPEAIAALSRRDDNDVMQASHSQFRPLPQSQSNGGEDSWSDENVPATLPLPFDPTRCEVPLPLSVGTGSATQGLHVETTHMELSPNVTTQGPPLPTAVQAQPPHQRDPIPLPQPIVDQSR